jgi:hypothetical protein
VNIGGRGRGARLFRLRIQAKGWKKIARITEIG